MPTTKIYDADQVTVSIGAILIEDGFDDGEFLTIENDEDAFVTKTSTDGMVTRSKTNNKMATITVKLMQSSPSNQALSAQHNADLLTPNGAGIVPFLVEDRSGSAIYTAVECWIHKAPNVSFDREATGREWTLKTTDLIRVDAGN